MLPTRLLYELRKENSPKLYLDELTNKVRGVPSLTWATIYHNFMVKMFAVEPKQL